MHGFGIDCDAEMGIFLLCFDSEAALPGSARQHAGRFHGAAARPAQRTSNMGDWKYHGFNLDQAHWDPGWEPFRGNHRGVSDG